MIDARDIAEFALRQPIGTFETSGPPHQISRSQLFGEIADLTGADVEFRWVPDEFLIQQDVEEWTEIPLWCASSNAPSLFAHDTLAAEGAGLACRTVRDTIAATWEWMNSIEGGWRAAERTSGLAADKEAEILARWTGGPA
jgi:hypothetical protein